MDTEKFSEKCLKGVLGTRGVDGVSCVNQGKKSRCRFSTNESEIIVEKGVK